VRPVRQAGQRGGQLQLQLQPALAGAGPDISAAAAASTAGLPLDEGRRRLGELTRAHLLAEHAPGRFSCHDLLRAYADELAQSADSEAERRAATGRMLDHYLHTAHSAALQLHPTRKPVTLSAPQPGADARSSGRTRPRAILRRRRTTGGIGTTNTTIPSSRRAR
jgi:hypothetical protein